jgi:hypothetical protein
MNSGTLSGKNSKYIVDEINAYIAIRDGLMVRLKPARPAYQAQHLPEADAVRERKRCQTVKARVAALRAHVVVDRQSHFSAALR